MSPIRKFGWHVSLNHYPINVQIKKYHKIRIKYVCSKTVICPKKYSLSIFQLKPEHDYKKSLLCNQHYLCKEKCSLENYREENSN